jgi:hypothetical protein
MIPTSLKTGFTNTQDDVLPEDLKNMQERISSIMMVLMKRSLVSAATYVLHMGGGKVEADHISKGIKAEATTFFDSEDLEQETEEMHERIFGDGADDSDASVVSDDDDSDVSSDEDPDYDEDDLDEDKKKMLDTFIDIVEDDLGTDGPSLDTRTEGETCQCEICSKMNNIDAIWEAWNVDDDPVKFFLKRHVDNTDRLVHQELCGDE